MKRWLYFLAGVVMGMSALSVSAAEVSAPAESSIGYLFVQTARSGTYADGVLTFGGVPEQTLFFADRPARKAGHIPTKKFLKNWKEGPDSFEQDPPNASLSILGGEKAVNVVFELKNPALKGSTL